MDVNLNKSLEIFKQAESLTKGDIRNLKQKDRKIISIAMSVVLKSKGGCNAKDISSVDLMDFKTHVTEKAPEKEQKSGLLTKLNKFIKNFFFGRISSQALASKMVKAGAQVQLLAKNEAAILQEKGAVGERIEELKKLIKEDESATKIVETFNLPLCNDLIPFFKELSKVKVQYEAEDMLEKKIDQYKTKIEWPNLDPQEKEFLQTNVLKPLTKIKERVELEGLENPNLKEGGEKKADVKREIELQFRAWSNTSEQLKNTTKQAKKGREKWKKELASEQNRFKELSNQESIIKSLEKHEPPVDIKTQKPPPKEDE